MTYLLSALYAGSAVLYAGLHYAFLQREFPCIAEETRRHDSIMVSLIAVLGLMALVAFLFVSTIWTVGHPFKHGFLFPFQRP